MNTELVSLLLRLAGTTLGLMAVVMLCCVVTPRLARFVDKHRPERPTKDEADPDAPEVKGAFDASSLPDYDLNYKIYNKDIYGVDFKHGKEKNGGSDNLDE